MTVRNVESPVEAAQERERSGAQGGNRHEIAAGEDVRHWVRGGGEGGGGRNAINPKGYSPGRQSTQPPGQSVQSVAIMALIAPTGREVSAECAVQWPLSPPGRPRPVRSICPECDGPASMLVQVAAPLCTGYRLTRSPASRAPELECPYPKHGNLGIWQARKHMPGQTRHGWLLRLGSSPPKTRAQAPVRPPQGAKKRAVRNMVGCIDLRASPSGELARGPFMLSGRARKDCDGPSLSCRVALLRTVLVHCLPAYHSAYQAVDLFADMWEAYRIRFVKWISMGRLCYIVDPYTCNHK